jgi:hypothetical protein
MASQIKPLPFLRLAICLVGPFRTFLYPGVYESFYENTILAYERKGVEVDTHIVTYEQDREDVSGKHDNVEAITPVFGLRYRSCVSEKSKDAAMKLIKPKSLVVLKDTSCSSFYKAFPHTKLVCQSNFAGYWYHKASSFECFHHTLQRRPQYSHVALFRPDWLWLKPLPSLNTFQSRQNVFVYYSAPRSEGTYFDGTLIYPRASLHSWRRRIEPLLRNLSWDGWDGRHWQDHWVPEYVMRNQGKVKESTSMKRLEFVMNFGLSGGILRSANDLHCFVSKKLLNYSNLTNEQTEKYENEVQLLFQRLQSSQKLHCEH